MKKISRLILIILITTSCSMKHKFQGVPDKVETQSDVNITPDFQSASDVCDERYGFRTEESDECFEEVLGFFDSAVSLDLDSLVDFCESRYEVVEDVEACEDDLVSAFGLVG